MARAKTAAKKESFVKEPEGERMKLGSEERRASFETALDSLRKVYGEYSVRRIDDQVLTDEEQLEGVISTGIIQVDRITTRGGFVRGSIVEIYGPESSGKTTLCLHLLAEVQKRGGTAVYIDAEHALDPQHVANCGVVSPDVIQPDCGEDALDAVEMLARAGTDLVIVDSVASLVPKAEIEGAMGDSHMGLQARLMSQALRKLTGICKKNLTTVVFINQIRHKIGVMFGSPETTTGGNALKFYSSIRIDMRRKDQIKINDNVVANIVRARVVKNKTGAPYKEETFNMFYDARRTVASNVIEFGAKIGVVDKAGAWYSYKGERLGQGVANAVEYLVTEKPELVSSLLQECRANLFKPVISLEEIDV